MKDIILDENTDLIFLNGDFKIFESTLQHQKLLLFTAKGHWKHAPEVGVGVENYFLNENYAGLLQETRKQLVMDGMSVGDIQVTNFGELQIKAEYA
ncbi:hypothetical protein [Raineya sp.]